MKFPPCCHWLVFTTVRQSACRRVGEFFSLILLPKFFLPKQSCLLACLLCYSHLTLPSHWKAYNRIREVRDFASSWFIHSFKMRYLLSLCCLCPSLFSESGKLLELLTYLKKLENIIHSRKISLCCTFTSLVGAVLSKKMWVSLVKVFFSHAQISCKVCVLTFNLWYV